MNNTTLTAAADVNETMPTLRMDKTVLITYVTLDSLFILACIVGNAYVISVIKRNLLCRSPNFIFILSVAVAHLLVGCIILPMFIVSHFPVHHMTDGVCKLIRYMEKVISTAGVVSLVPLTFNVFLQHSRFRRRFEISKFNGRITVLIIWLCSFVYATWAAVLYRRQVLMRWGDTKMWTVVTCEVPAELKYPYKVIIAMDTICLYFIPFTTMFAMYVGIFYWQWVGSGIQPQDGDTGEDPHLKDFELRIADESESSETKNSGRRYSITDSNPNATSNRVENGDRRAESVDLAGDVKIIDSKNGCADETGSTTANSNGVQSQLYFRRVLTISGVISLIVFGLCNLGICVMTIELLFDVDRDVHYKLKYGNLSKLIYYTQSWMNVVLLFAFNKRFRQAARGNIP
ncbi:uncharacterized protein LOC141911984 [Tubulanus polymorphus]|uniref:uncharacterized protein LOC141911984 n=1 Tax=Tubulanus polymorphus TaxID=672921 RepID=UPI003DA3F1B1